VLFRGGRQRCLDSDAAPGVVEDVDSAILDAPAHAFNRSPEYHGRFRQRQLWPLAIPHGASPGREEDGLDF